MVLLKNRRDVSTEFLNKWGLFFYYKKMEHTFVGKKCVLFLFPQKRVVNLLVNTFV